ncbi:MAG: alpha/beta fold hydrolase [Candidatus Hodarchaeota archaeon]
MGELFVDVNGIKICYEIFGKGEPFILLHGFAMYKEFWITQVKGLSDNFKLITLDLRGCGNSSHPKEAFNMETIADDVKYLMDYLKIEKAHLTGHSFGGMVAQHFALKYPNRLDKLILMATFPNLPLDKSGLEMYKRSQLENYKAKEKDFSKAFYDKMKQRFTRSFYKEMVENPSKEFHGLFSTENLIEFEKSKGTSKPQDILNQIEAIVKHNTVDKLHKIKNEVLILAGEKDRIVSKIASSVLQDKIPNSILKILEGSHFFPLEQAPEVNKIIIDFLMK